MRTILQVPVDPKIRMLAEKSALNMGFSSLQESLRLIMHQMALNKIGIKLNQQEPDEILTPEQEKILIKKMKASKREIAKGNFVENSDINELMAYLDK